MHPIPIVIDKDDQNAELNPICFSLDFTITQWILQLYIFCDMDIHGGNNPHCK